jgi:hypothetical protein
MKYRQQLLIYKILVESSSRYKGYKVVQATLEFVEPNEDGRIVRLELNYTDQDVENMKMLVKAVWQKVKVLDLPSIEKYSPSISGIRAFEKDLIAEL